MFKILNKNQRTIHTVDLQKKIRERTIHGHYNLIKFSQITILGSVPDTLSSAYNTAALPQYGGGIYSTTPLQTSSLTAAASIVAGKQIEGKLLI